MRLRLSLQGTEETKRNKVLIKGSIPTRATVLPAINQEPTDRGKKTGKLLKCLRGCIIEVLCGK